MERRILGATGISVGEMALGAMMFGAGGNPDHGDSVRVIHAALDAGISLVDTADVYSSGESEIIVGQAIKGRPPITPVPGGRRCGGSRSRPRGLGRGGQRTGRGLAGRADAGRRNRS